MDTERLFVSRENPRPLAFPTGQVLPSTEKTSADVKSVPNDVAQKPTSVLLDRFRALLRQREDELRISYGEDVPPPTTEDIVQLYELVLSELTLNSKPIITDLTIIAGEQREHARGIADAICSRILEVSAEHKLPSLYLLDSIVKNIGRDYVRFFSLHLPEVFCEAYRQVQPNLHNSMRHLFGTWSAVFPPSILRKIEAQLQLSQTVNNPSALTQLRTSASPRPTHGIHVNPKYLRQFEQTNADNIGAERLKSTRAIVHANSGLGSSKIHPPSSVRLRRSTSPSRFGVERSSFSSFDESTIDNSSRIIERESPSQSAFDYGVGNSIACDEEFPEWRRKQFNDDSRGRDELPSTYSPSNGHEPQSPRSLIQAYGSDRREKALTNRNLMVEQMDVNGIDKMVARKSWKHSEEEEFDWEDMSPTLVDRARNTDYLPSKHSFRPIPGQRPSFTAADAAILELDGRNTQSSPAQLLPLDVSSIDAEELYAHGRGLVSNIGGLQTKTTQAHGSHHPHDTWNPPYNLPQSSQYLLPGKGRGRNLHPLPVENLPRAEINPYGHSHFGSRISSTGQDSVNLDARSSVFPSTFPTRPPVGYTTRPPTSNPRFPFQKNVRNQFNVLNATNIVNQGPVKSLLLSEQQLESFENKDFSLMKPPLLPSQHLGQITNKRDFERVSTSKQQFLPSDDVQENFLQTTPGPRTASFTPLSSSHGRGPSLSAVMLNATPVTPFQLTNQNIANSSFRLQQRPLPTHLLGPPPVSSEMVLQQNAGPILPIQPPHISAIFNSLMATGVLSLPNQTSAQDSLGTDFNPDVLKVRHDSAIRSLYYDLPRQCTTCGLRFKCQEEHSSHMDWHVTRNRMSKNRKQKSSRKWFVSQGMWLSGAEALGAEAVPGFLTPETVEEKKDEEEMSVPAEEEHNVCALCGEPFEEFYSDESEEWMYKGAVYLHASKGSTVGMDRSQLGPIVHAKCRSESSGVPSEDFRPDEGGTTEEGNQQKRMRIN